MPHFDFPQSHCRVGVARGDITPPVGAYHRMWGAATHERSTGIHRPLAATVLVIQPANGDAAPQVLIALDHCILNEPELAGIRQRVVNATSFATEHLHIALSHTHGAGLTTRDRADLPGGDLLFAYLDEMAVRIGTLATEAERSLQPASIMFGQGRCDLATHRDFYDEERGGFVVGFNPGVPADDTLMVARIRNEHAKTIATIVNYACHPTTLAWQNTLVSPDYIGTLREVVEGATGGAPCVFLQGASGELGPREGFVGDHAVADRNGRQLGYAALSALEALPPDGTRFIYTGAVVSGAILGTWAYEPIQPPTLMRVRHWTVPVPYRTDLSTLDQTRADRERYLAEEQAALAAGDPIKSRDLHALVEQMTRQIMRLEAMPPGDGFPLPITIWQTGDAFWVFVAGEHYSVLQTRLRERFAAPIIVSTITDGWQPGYLPTAETYGKGIYQEIIAMVGPDSLERVIAAVSGQLDEWGVAHKA